MIIIQSNGQKQVVVDASLLLFLLELAIDTNANSEDNVYIEMKKNILKELNQ